MLLGAEFIDKDVRFFLIAGDSSIGRFIKPLIEAMKVPRYHAYSDSEPVAQHRTGF